MTERPHKKLEVWKQAMLLVQLIYKSTNNFPESERFGLSSQMRRAAVSIPSNIAEGAARDGIKEFKHFLNISQGSLSELDTQVEIALILNYLDQKTSKDLLHRIEAISKMIFGLIKTVGQGKVNSEK